MIRAHHGILPRRHPGVFIDASAQVIGEVEMGGDSGGWMHPTTLGDAVTVPTPASTRHRRSEPGAI